MIPIHVTAEAGSIKQTLPDLHPGTGIALEGGPNGDEVMMVSCNRHDDGGRIFTIGKDLAALVMERAAGEPDPEALEKDREVETFGRGESRTRALVTPAGIIAVTFEHFTPEDEA